jgi:flagellar basal-body rod protein FlgC
MSTFSAIGTAGSALQVYRTWMDAVSDNISNIDTVSRTSEKAFQPRFVLAAPTEHGVEITGVGLGSEEGRMSYEPTHALADAQGMVRRPDTDMVDQMAQLMVAQRGYQANISVVQQARETYLAALQIGR